MSPSKMKRTALSSAIGLAMMSYGVTAATLDLNKGYVPEISNVKSYSQDKTINNKTRYIIQLEDEPLATYKGGIIGLQATSAEVTGESKLNLSSNQALKYSSYLKAKQKSVARDAVSISGGAVSHTFSTLFNGVVIEGAEGQREALARLPGVKKVFLDTEYHTVMDASIDVIKGVEAWQALGGQSEAGKGVKVAIIDSGIRPENPMFSDVGFTAPEFSEEEAAYLATNPDYCRMDGGEADFCNNKLIVARAFGPTPSSVHPDEYIGSPLGYDGHGTHVAGTAVGNPMEITYQGNNVSISGVAPAAQLMAYKALWHTADGRGSGTTTALMSALEAAIKDGADVINNSWGGGAGANPASSAYSDLFTAAEEAGVVVVTAAGNDGNGPQTIGCPGCIESGLTVANTQTGRFFSQQIEVDGESYLSIEGSNGLLKETLSLPVISAQVIAPDNFEGCEEFAEGISFADSVALISRGACAFSVKAENAAKAGASAVIIHNNTAGGAMGMSMDDAPIPASAISQEDGLSLVELLKEAEEPVIATLDPSVQRTIVAKFTDAVNSSSSRGPNGEPSFLKPDIAAPGTDILSAYSPDEGNGLTFTAISGTSMASPHVAGAAALIKQAHPEWDAVQIKTALMSTSKMDGLHKEDLVTKADAFDVGAGRLDVPSALNASLTFSHGSYADPSCLSVCSFKNTVQNMSDTSGEWTAKVVTDMDGAEISISPSTITLEANGSVTTGEDNTETRTDIAEFNLDIDSTYNSVKGWNFGHVVWTHSETGQVAHLPFAIYDNEETNASFFTANVDADSLNSSTPAKVGVKFANSGFENELTVNVKLDENAELLKGTSPLVEVARGAGEVTVSEDNKELTWTGKLDPKVMTLSDDNLLGTFSLAEAGATAVACPNGCDEFTVTVDADFIYDGKEYSAFTVSDNGFVAVGSDVNVSGAWSPRAFPNTRTPNGVIAPLWADYDLAGGATGGGELYIATLESGHIVIEWHDVEEYASTSGDKYTFQVILKEGTDEVRINYIDVPALPSAYSAGAESADGGVGVALSTVPTGTALGQGYMVEQTQGGTVEIQYQAFAKDRSNYTSADSVVTDEEQTININVLENDMGESRFTFDGKAASELDNAEFLVHKGVKVKGSLESSTVKVVSAPSNGTATVKEDGTIDYKPNAQFAGEDSFTYTVRESSGMESEETSVSIVVNDTIADPAPVVEEPKKKSSSGSLAWLTLLAAPFAFMRRRKQK
ncbi:S8 family serine peptidase [Pseudoalteromonas sp. ACER1]|uniref:S8 family serine peptidase n=1 Tax=unclassified Pseudoalteromonas TaxID=194690 RepID=UPI001F491B71|nr:MULTISPECIES: S8 family serine peptidase [unclassified Pseudoalteromonas]MCF2847771.1 S8 family serine peptidase [Pseudoalteromonas sp. PAST1]MCO7211422.1 S8 family serine peptidase [Pseudoalteromonas sp. ACER1]